MKMSTTGKILQTMNSWQSGEVIAVRRKKCSGASSHPSVGVLHVWHAPPSSCCRILSGSSHQPRVSYLLIQQSSSYWSPVKCDSVTSSKAPTPVPNGFYRGILSFVCGYDTARLLEYSTIDTRTIFPSCQCPIQVASSALYWFPVSTSIFSSLTTTENEPASVLSTEIACILWFKYKLKGRLNTNYFYVLFIHYLDVLI